MPTFAYKGFHDVFARRFCATFFCNVLPRCFCADACLVAYRCWAPLLDVVSGGQEAPKIVGRMAGRAVDGVL
jgi:hypothetical protein